MKFLFVFFIFLAMQVVCVGQHEYIDLGLPSGTLWATCNVGANKPENFGYCFAWGETEKVTYSIFKNWTNYKYALGDENKLTKYCTKSNYGNNNYTDNLTVLDYSDDAATANWGNDWCMPTIEQFEELRDNCSVSYDATLNGTEGYEFRGKNGNTIFFPLDCTVTILGEYCTGYWSSTLEPDSPESARCFISGGYSSPRISDLYVRPVRRNKQEQNNSQTTNSQSQTSTTQPTTTIDGHAYVDLGLPSGTKWATCNIGANNPWESGDYFAWGEINSKSYYDWSTYKYANRKFTKLTKYCNIRSYGNKRYTDSHINLERSDDVASQKWGNKWCIPTGTQFKELKEKCIWTWTIRNGKNGYEVKGPNGKSIFLPITGLKGSGALEDAKYSGQYWLSSLNTDLPFCALGFGFQSDNNVYMKDYFIRYYGMSVRPVLRQ